MCKCESFKEGREFGVFKELKEGECGWIIVSG